MTFPKVNTFLLSAAVVMFEGVLFDWLLYQNLVCFTKIAIALVIAGCVITLINAVHRRFPLPTFPLYWTAVIYIVGIALMVAAKCMVPSYDIVPAWGGVIMAFSAYPFRFWSNRRRIRFSAAVLSQLPALAVMHYFHATTGTALILSMLFALFIYTASPAKINWMLIVSSTLVALVFAAGYYILAPGRLYNPVDTELRGLIRLTLQHAGDPASAIAFDAPAVTLLNSILPCSFLFTELIGLYGWGIGFLSLLPVSTLLISGLRICKQAPDRALIPYSLLSTSVVLYILQNFGIETVLQNEFFLIGSTPSIIIGILLVWRIAVPLPF